MSKQLEVCARDAAVDVLLEFLEVAIHSILHIRGIYPSGIFVKTQKYEIPVYVSIFSNNLSIEELSKKSDMSVHPELNQYIANCLCSMRPLLLKDRIKAVAVTMINAANELVEERFVFEIAKVTKETGLDIYALVDTERAFRALCLKIATITSEMKPLPKGCRFVVQLHTTELMLQDSQLDCTLEDFVWIKADKQQSSMQDPIILPLRTCNSNMLNMQLFIETKEPS